MTALVEVAPGVWDEVVVPDLPLLEWLDPQPPVPVVMRDDGLSPASIPGRRTLTGHNVRVADGSGAEWLGRFYARSARRPDPLPETVARWAFSHLPGAFAVAHGDWRSVGDWRRDAGAWRRLAAATRNTQATAAELEHALRPLARALRPRLHMEPRPVTATRPRREVTL